MIRPEFGVHRLNEHGLSLADVLATAFSNFLTEIEGIAGTGGREMAIVRTKLEEASFFAKKAMASQPQNQQ